MPSLASARPTSLAVRAVLLLVASLLAIWLAVGHRNVRYGEQALLDLRKNPPAIDHALSLANDQSFLNLGRDPLQIKAIVLWNAGERTKAIAQARVLVAQEPANRQAWTLLAYFLRSSDPAGAAQALGRARALSGPSR